MGLGPVVGPNPLEDCCILLYTEPRLETLHKYFNVGGVGEQHRVHHGQPLVVPLTEPPGGPIQPYGAPLPCPSVDDVQAELVPRAGTTSSEGGVIFL